MSSQSGFAAFTFSINRMKGVALILVPNVIILLSSATISAVCARIEQMWVISYGAYSQCLTPHEIHISKTTKPNIRSYDRIYLQALVCRNIFIALAKTLLFLMQNYYLKFPEHCCV